MRPLFALFVLLFGSLDLSAAITGHVIDETGKPIAGARVRALAVEPSDVEAPRLLSDKPEPEPLATATADDKGAFRIDTKKQPVVMLVIDAPGRAIRTEEVPDGMSAGAVVLRAASAKKGRVTANGKPVAGAWVIFDDAFFAKTDERGDYTVPDPAQWASFQIVVHPDFAVLQRTRGREPLGADAVLDAGTAVRGRVLDAAGAPVPNATIFGGTLPLAKSGEDGSFSIAHLSSDVKQLRAVEGTRTGAAKPDAQTIVLRPGGRLTGTIRSTKDGTPVGGMKVTMRGADPTVLAPTVISDAKGNFAFENALPGTVSLAMSHPAYFAAGVIEADITSGGRVDRAVAATPFARVTGTIVDEEKKPVSGARVGFHGLGHNAWSAPDGSFSVRVPPNDRAITLDAAKESYAGVTHGPIQLEAGEVRTGVRLVLPRGTKFEVQLVDTTGGLVAGEPVQIFRRTDDPRARRIPLACAGSSSTTLSPDNAPCRSDAEGKVMVNLVDGTYDMQAGGETTVSKELRAQTLSAATTPMVIELERGAVVEGRVVFTDGTAMTSPANVFVHGSQNASAPVTNGTFTLRNVPAGKVVLAVRGSYPLMIEGDPVEVQAPATGVVLKMPRPGRIEGRVVDRESQRAVRQFNISTESRTGASRGNTNRRPFTDDDGKFVLESVPPGTYDVVALASGYARTTTSGVEVAEGKTATVELELERGATVIGKVTAAGQPVSGASVSAGETARTWRSQVKQTDANGEYVLDTLSPGNTEITVRKQGFVTRTLPVNAEVGKETRVDVELSRGRELQGRVLDESGQPVGGATITHRPAGRGGMGSAFLGAPPVSDSAGNFRLEGLGDDALIVSARKEGYAESSTEVNPASSALITITLARGGSISGRVSGLPPAELPFVEVYATRVGVGGTPSRVNADANGAFVLGGVGDGEYIVTAQESRPPRRQVRSPHVKVVAGNAPFIELDFASGIAVSGRVTINGQPTRGSIHFTSADATVRQSASAEIAPDGTYEVRVPAAGTYRVYVSPAGRSSGTLEGARVNIRAEMRHDVELRGGALRGRVIDAVTGEPLADSAIELRTPDRGATRHTDSSGQFLFELVMDGTYTVRAVKAGYADERREVIVTNGTAPDVELALGRGELVTVMVVDAASKRPLDAIIQITAAPGPPAGLGGLPQRARDGSYRYWLRPGEYSVRVSARGYEVKVLPLTVPRQAPLQIELAPAPASP